jgi:hypothetical protein
MTKRTHKETRKLSQRPFNHAAACIGDAVYSLSRASFATSAMVFNIWLDFKPTAEEVYNCKAAILMATSCRLRAADHGRYLP